MLHLLDRDLWAALLGAGLGGVAFAALCALAHQVRRTLPPRSQAFRKNAGVRADDLEGVEGIGPKIADLLRRANITSYADLATQSPAQLREILGRGEPRFRTADPASWPLQAELLRDGKVSAFLMLAVALRGGAPRLEDVRGIGDAIGAHLRKSGIRSPADLADVDSSELVLRLSPTLPRLSHRDAEQWIDDAKALHRGDREALLKLAALRIEALPNAAGQSEADPSDPLADAATPRSGPFPVGAPGRGIGDCFLCTALPAALLALLALVLGRAPPAGTTVVPPACVAPKVCMVPPPVPPTVVIKRKFASGTFKFNEYQQTSLTPDGAAALTAFVDEMKARLAKDRVSPTAVVVVGHADRFGSEKANELLSERRARAVERYLEDQLAWPSDIFFSYGRGERTPDPTANTAAHCAFPKVPTQADKDCSAPDRRVVVTVVF